MLHTSQLNRSAIAVHLNRSDIATQLSHGSAIDLGPVIVRSLAGHIARRTGLDRLFAFNTKQRFSLMIRLCTDRSTPQRLCVTPTPFPQIQPHRTADDKQHHNNNPRGYTTLSSGSQPAVAVVFYSPWLARWQWIHRLTDLAGVPRTYALEGAVSSGVGLAFAGGIRDGHVDRQDRIDGSRRIVVCVEGAVLRLGRDAAEVLIRAGGREIACGCL